MQKSESIAALAAALAKAQGEFPDIPKDKSAKVPTKAGGSYSYDYADLSTILRAVTPVLSRNGLSHVQPVRSEGNKVTVLTMLVHSSGEWIAEDFSMSAADDRPQSLGAATTYARRYGLASMLGVSPDEDRDANEDGETKPKAKAEAKNGHQAAATAIKAAANDPASRKAACLARLSRLGKEGKDLRTFVGLAIGRTLPGTGPITLNDMPELEKLEAAVVRAEEAHKAAETLARAKEFA